MATIKENYESINAILRQNEENVKEVHRVIEKIKGMYEVCIPILKAMAIPSIECNKMVTRRKIEVVSCGIEKETLQVMLDEISPMKLVVEDISRISHSYCVMDEIIVSFA